MTATVIEQLSSKIVQLNSGQSIAIYSSSDVSVSELIASPIYPISFRKIGSVKDRIIIFGPFNNGATLKLETSNAQSLYEIGIAPTVKLMAPYFQIAVGPAAFASDALLPSSAITNGTILLQSFGSTPVNLTLPSGTDIEKSSQWSIFETFRFNVINQSTNADLVIVGTEPGIFLFANTTIAPQTSAMFRIHKTLDNNFTVVKIA